MNRKKLHSTARVLLACGAAMLLLPDAGAFPPAPYHTIFGMIRDEYGNPLPGPAEVVLESYGGLKVVTSVSEGLDAGVNYKLSVPMDGGSAADLYSANALRPMVQFKMRVRIDGVGYLPIQMSGDYRSLGDPGAKTRIDLTLGIDADGDGLPDAWERLLAQQMGLDQGQIGPNDDSDGDGISNLDEYLAGTYAFDDKDGFNLKIAGQINGNPVLEFLAIKGRTYTIVGSSDLATWTAVEFKPAGSTAAAKQSYYADDVKNMRVEAAPAGQNFSFFKLMVQ